MTVNGRHTMEEVRQLIAAKDVLIKQISDAFTSSNWTGRDAEVWKSDWYDFNQRWIDMKRRVSAALVATSIMSPGVPANVTPAETEWQWVLRAINKSGTGLYEKGDLPDMQQRLERIVGPFVDSSKIPKQDSWDADHSAYLKADQGVKAVEKAATSDTAIKVGIAGALVLGALIYLKK